MTVDAQFLDIRVKQKEKLVVIRGAHDEITMDLNQLQSFVKTLTGVARVLGDGG